MFLGVREGDCLGGRGGPAADLTTRRRRCGRGEGWPFRVVRRGGGEDGPGGALVLRRGWNSDYPGTGWKAL